MHKKIISSVLGILLLASPAYASVSTIEELQSQIRYLLKQIEVLKAQNLGTVTPTSCTSFTYNLYIGKSDAATNGEVSKLQKFLIAEGVYPEAKVTGYYGNLTAAAVMRWQKAHGMDFVTLKSGVGPMTRAKISESCAANVQVSGWEKYQGDGFEFQYPKDTLALFPVTQSIYSENPRYTGMKLILQSRVAKLGKSECPDGGKGETIVCSVAGADGIAFLVAEDSIANVIAPLEKSLFSTATVGAIQVTTFEHGAEGDGARMYFVPLGSQRTLIVYQRYSCCLVELSFPKGLVEKILSTLKFTN